MISLMNQLGYKEFAVAGHDRTEGLFDNLKTAVHKIVQGRDRLEQEAFLALQAHYLFKAEFCNVRSGNRKTTTGNMTNHGLKVVQLRFYEVPTEVR
ncbi:hypothetical protein SAMN05428981_1011293 [Bacillus sp. OV194]|nr:hypothetical protein SAMN05428981_1011293 [Bacillus sp. OV194]